MDDEYLDAKAACRSLGGTKPINPSTPAPGRKRAARSPPDHIGPNMVRSRRSQLARDLERIAAHGGRPPHDETAA